MKRIYSLLFILLCAYTLSACIEGTGIDFADNTRVFVTNNSSETLTVSIVTNAPGSVWSQLDSQIEAYETKPVLQIQRKQNYPAESVFDFTVVLEDVELNQIELQQRLSYGNFLDQVSFGLSAASLNSGLKSDTKHYQYSGVDGYDFNLAFEAKNKAVHKDIYYALTPKPESIALNQQAEQLSVLTYNIWGLTGISSDIATRFNLIPRYVRQYDVLLLQEVFDPRRSGLLADLRSDYPFQTAILNGPANNLFDGGIVVLSRFPIVAEASMVYPDCTGFDCQAEKGVVYAKVDKLGTYYHVFATHAASFDTTNARNLRQVQFQQMRDFALTQTIPTDEIVVYGGDLNVNKLRFSDDYANMLSSLQAQEPTYEGYTKASFDPDINVYATDGLSGANDPEYLDYILVSDEFGAYEQLNNDVFILRDNHEDLWQKWDLSDHFPVRALIQTPASP